MKRTQIAYRCPECAVMTVGFLGGLSSVSDMLRLKCSCGDSSLDIKKQPDGKINLSAPCVYCKSNHSYVVSPEIMIRDELTRFNCPYSGMGIVFIGNEDDVKAQTEQSAEELSRIMTSLDAEDVSDIQPEDVDEDAAAPDPAIFDTFNFLLRDLESEGAVRCPCPDGEYDLRFCKEGIQAFCAKCGATYTFNLTSPAASEDYLSLDSLTLS